MTANWQELALRADSFLVRLSDAEFTAGLAALHAQAIGKMRSIEHIHFFAFRA